MVISGVRLVWLVRMCDGIGVKRTCFKREVELRKMVLREDRVSHIT